MCRENIYDYDPTKMAVLFIIKRLLFNQFPSQLFNSAFVFTIQVRL